MILVTVGTQLPFPRLLDALDGIAVRNSLRVVAQTCGDLPGARALEQQPFLAPERLAELAGEARLIIGHAGIGTIFAGMRAGKPLVLYPRRAALGEHRNEHQLATAAAMAGRPGIYVAWDDAELERLVLAEDLEPARAEASPTRPALIEAVAEFVRG